MVDTNISFVGSGQMARALAKGFVGATLLPAGKIAAFDAVPAGLTATGISGALNTSVY